MNLYMTKTIPFYFSNHGIEFLAGQKAEHESIFNEVRYV